MRSAAIGVLIIGGLIAPAQAETGNDLLSKCEAFLNNYHSRGQGTFELSGDVAVSFQCFGYMSAIGEFGFLYDDGGRRAIEHVCLPHGTDTTQLIRVLVNYGHQHPETLHEAAILFALNSLVSAFPCKQ